MSGPRTRPSFWLWALALGGAGLLAVVGAFAYLKPPPSDAPPPAGAAVRTATAAEVHTFCGHCHAYPPADTFPRSAWKLEVERGYAFFERSHPPLQPPSLEGVIRYYEERAPLELPVPTIERAATPLPVRFAQTAFAGPLGTSPPSTSNVRLVHLFDDKRLDVLACDMRWGLVMALSPYKPNAEWKVLARISHPAHVEVVDLDGDGVKDLLVANLGNFKPTDRHCGSVVWLRGTKDGRFTPITLLEDVGRVADVRAADFRGVGKLDLIVAAFGWKDTGEILYLENQTTDWSKPKFVKRVLDARHGAIHVPVADLNGDGKPDFVALISQEHETVVAFLNEGGGKFRKETIYTASHPGYGSSGIQLVDLNGDGNLDVLYTNGDVLDLPYLLKPYHSVQWLENPGPGKFPFIHHHLTAMYGVHRAVAADVDGDGRLDVVAVSFLPVEAYPQRKQRNLDAVVVLRQTAPGRFARHSLETGTCDHVTCAVGDVFGAGRADLVIGNYSATQPHPPVTFWRNLGKK